MTKLFLLTFFFTLISACENQRENDFPAPGSADSLNIALNNGIEKNILPGISSFKTKSELLQTKTGVFCSNTPDSINQENLIALQNQWKVLSLQWNQVAMFNIGPLNDSLFDPKINFIESMRLRGTDYTATVRAGLTSRLSDATLLDQNYFDRLNFNHVGMLALEVLLFEESGGTNSTDLSLIVSDYKAHSNRKCEYLTGMVALLVRHASEVEHGWLVEFLDTGKPFKTILLNGELADGAEPVPALITVIQQHLDYLKKRKLEAILDAQISDHFYQNISASLDAIENLLQGVDEDSYSFFNHMLSGGFSEQVDIVKKNLNTARQAATAKNRSELTIAIGLLDGNFKREIPNSLNVTLGIVFTDGD